MKKLFAAVLTAMIGFSVFAQEKGSDYILNFGVGFPQANGSVGSDDEDFKTSGVVFAFQMVNVMQNKFTWFVSLDLGAAGTDDLTGDKEWGFAMAYNVGLGYSPIHDDKITLSIMGFIGYDMMLFDPKISGYDVDIFAWTFDVGADIYFNYRIGQNIGLFADIKLLGAFGYELIDIKYGGYIISDSEGLTAFGFKPSIGLSVSF